MKTKKTIILSIAALMAIGLMSFDILYGTGESDKTGSPADGGTTCRDCHGDFALNAAGGSVTITTSPLIPAGYTPGAIYTISVTVAKTGQTEFGFDLEALKTGNTNGGILAVLNTSTQIMGTPVTNMVHNGVGIGTGTKTFTFKWTAPAAGTGTVTFYASGNACDGDGSTGGDYVYTSSLVVIEDLTIGIANYSYNSNISVYPNPASNNIYIKNASNENLNLIMFDLTGRETLSLENFSDQNNTVSLSDISNGTYILKVYNETGLLKTDKIVVMH